VRAVLIAALALAAAAPVRADDAFRDWSIHFQSTSIGDMHGGFPSPYEGENSLPPHFEARDSLTATAFLATSVGKHVQFIFNPELAGGKGFGDVTGIAGFPNGEIPRVAAPTPTLYLARGFVKITWGFGDENETVEDGPNQLKGERPVRRFTWYSGRFSVTDFFDNNAYSHDPRSQFMNWSLMSNGAWDYPADVRGYTVGTVGEFTMKTWSLRAALAMEPSVANGPDLDTRVAKNRGAVAEWERRYSPRGHAGALRVLGYLNREDAGTFRQAFLPDGTVDIDATRRNGTKKYGFGVNLEQEITRDIGVFGRYGWSDGKTEAWAFTQIDRSLSGGAAVRGRLWRRERDRAGVAAVQNWLSGDQRRFLAAGGLGFIVGDGRLNYRPESIVEAYYAWSALKQWTITADYQHVTNPAYNQDRGPVNVWSLRLHWER
jgi:high affinity Mn2+ porin